MLNVRLFHEFREKPPENRESASGTSLRSVQCFGGSSEVAFHKNVASEESLAPLFTAIEADQVSSADAQSGGTAKANERMNKEEFVGDNAVIRYEWPHFFVCRNSRAYSVKLLNFIEITQSTAS